MIKIKVLKLNEDAKIPSYVHEGDSGMDLYAISEYILRPGERCLIGTGLKFEIPEGYEAQIRSKSGLALKYGICVLNSPGTIDSNYRGEIKVILINHGKEDYKIEKGSKIAQIVFQKIERVNIEEVNEVNNTSRGNGGFGSTGLK